MSRSHGLFQLTGSLNPGRSTFPLSYSKKFDANFGPAYPVMCDEVVPHDTWHGGNQCVVRAVIPLRAPVMQNWKVYTHYFFVPYRILDEKWEEFITGGVTGNSDVSLPISYFYGKRSDSTPGSFKDAGGIYNTVGAVATSRTTTGSLNDFLYGVVNTNIPLDDIPMSYPEMAYYTIFNEYYRDETLQHPIMCKTMSPDGSVNENRHPAWKIGEESKGQLECFDAFAPTGSFETGCPYLNKGLFYRSWKKDYFTSALPWQQRGDAPILPINMITTFSPSDQSLVSGVSSLTATLGYTPVASGGSVKSVMHTTWGDASTTMNSRFISLMNSGLKTTIDPNKGLIDVADLRWMFQMQKWMERNARAGIRYTEFLKAHFGISPRDDRMQRPEYLGGSVQNIVVSEVLQTSASETGSTAQGNMAGHGLSVNGGHCFDYTASEFGLIMGLMTIMPAAEYQQGLNRQWSRKVREEFYFPEFQNLSEQAILGKEIYCSSDTEKNNKVFGYQGMYDELRTKHNLTCGRLRNGEAFDYWTMSRYFSDLPQLNDSFIRCKPETVGVFSTDENPFIVNFGNILSVTRPISAMSNPGLTDHF